MSELFLSFYQFFAGLLWVSTPHGGPAFFCPSSVKALHQLIYRRKFPFTKIGGRIFVDAAELDRFLGLSRKTTVEAAVGREAA